MPRTSRKLDALAALLERTNGDPKRIEAVRRAQGFRRSWIELAEILVRIRNSGQYEAWGFADFHDYCQQELTLKRGTVDKLTISYSTLERHAPQVLERDGVANSIPSYESLDYYHRTVGEFEEREDAANDEGEVVALPRSRRLPQRPSADLRREFEQAVFDEGQPVAELRKRYDEVFFPKAKGADQLDTIRRASATARKLAALLAEIRGLPEKQAMRVEAELGKLRETLDDLAKPLAEKVAKATARANQAAAAAWARPASEEDSDESDEGQDESDESEGVERIHQVEAAPRKRKRAGPR